MNTTRFLACLLVLSACGGKDPAPPIVPASGTPAGAGGGEDCNNGVDDDGDGLLDCEDEDCDGNAACFESDCGNNEDDDGDGYFDCGDADCWGRGCAVSMARITSSGPVVWVEGALDLSTNLASCSSYHLDTATISLQSPTGRLRYLSPDGGSDFTSCDWSATRSWVAHHNATDPFSTPRLVLRSGFTIDPTCPIQDTRFLPLILTMAEEPGVRGMRTGLNGAGPVWFGMTGPADSNYFDTVGPVGPAGSCNFVTNGERGSSTWNSPNIDFDFVLAAPTLELPTGVGTGTGTGTGSAP